MKRRSFLKNVAVSAAGATAVSVPFITSAKNINDKNNNELDVIVVGGGFAGVTAARDLSQNGAKTLLLEARPRLGGRTFTSNFGGHYMDMGGTWFGWGQPNIWAEKLRYNLPLSESASVKAETFIWYDKGQRKEGTAGEYWPDVYEAYDKFYEPAFKHLNRPYDPLFHDSAELRKLDSMSAKEAIEALNLSDLQKDFLKSFASINGHSDASKSSYLDQLRWIALANYNKDFMWANLGQFKLKNGMSRLIDKMMADCTAEVKLGTAATKVVYTESGVSVFTNRGEELKAKYVVMAAPLNVLNDISYSPAISTIKQKAFKQGHTGSGIKIYIKVKGKHPIIFANGTEDMALNYLWTEYDDDDQILVGFGKDPELLDVYDDEAIQAAVRKYLPTAEVIESFSYDWNIDPYSKGTWCMYPPGMLTNAFKDMNTPEGPVHFAGADFAYGWRGFIDGAIESGARSAQIITDKLKKLKTERKT